MKKSKRTRTVVIAIVLLLAVSCTVALYLVQAGVIDIPNPHDMSKVLRLMTI